MKKQAINFWHLGRCIAVCWPENKQTTIDSLKEKGWKMREVTPTYYQLSFL